LRDDSCTLKFAGVVEGCIVTPCYDSSAYTEPLLDLDFYLGACPDGGATAASLSEGAKRCGGDACAALRHGGDQVRRGAEALFSGLRGGLCGPAAGIGVAVEQDEATLRFRVLALAPGGAVDRDGRIRRGDSIVAVDGRRCANAAGLDPARAAALRDLCSRDSGGWAWPGEDARAIAEPSGLREALAGPAGSWVAVRLRREGPDGADWEEEYEARLERRPLAHLAADYT
jgi:hypothetical protein